MHFLKNIYAGYVIKGGCPWGNVLELSLGNVQGEMSRGKCPRPLSDELAHGLCTVTVFGSKLEPILSTLHAKCSNQ